MSEYDPILESGRSKDFGVRGGGSADMQPGDAVEAVLAEERQPVQWHAGVQQKFHAEGASGTSYSCIRHAA